MGIFLSGNLLQNQSQNHRPDDGIFNILIAIPGIRSIAEVRFTNIRISGILYIRGVITMIRSEIVLEENQKDLLDTIAFIVSRKRRKRVTRASLIRESIKYWIEHIGMHELSDSELIINNPVFLNDIKAAKEDLKAGREYTHEEMLKELDK